MMKTLERDELGLGTRELIRLSERAERPCIWCGRFVEWYPPADMNDPQQIGEWHTDGDFGCDPSPKTNDDGVGGHLVLEDVAGMLVDREREQVQP